MAGQVISDNLGIGPKIVNCAPLKVDVISLYVNTYGSSVFS